jgi:RNA 3'-terminal phosphate cyclase-like protein
MGREKSRRLSGSRDFRQRLVLATLTSTAVTIEDIRSGDAAPGLRPHEVSLLRLLDKISDSHTIDLNEPGMDLPGLIVLCVLPSGFGYGGAGAYGGVVLVCACRNEDEVPEKKKKKMRYQPGVIVVGKGLEHECGVRRGIGYFLELLILLGLFSRGPTPQSPILIRLKGEGLICLC